MRPGTDYVLSFEKKKKIDVGASPKLGRANNHLSCSIAAKVGQTEPTTTRGRFAANQLAVAPGMEACDSSSSI